MDKNKCPFSKKISQIENSKKTHFLIIKFLICNMVTKQK